MTMQRTTGDLPHNFFAQALRGSTYPFEALRFSREHNLWGLMTIPIVINIILFGIVASLSFVFVLPWMKAFGIWLAAMRPDIVVIGAIVGALIYLVWILLGVVLIGLSGFFILLLGQAIASPFLDILSERVEYIVLGTPEEPLTAKLVMRALIFGITDLVWSIIYLLAFQIPILMLGLIPGVGTIPASILSFSVTALLLSQEFVGLPLTRKWVGYRRRWTMIWQNKWLTLGFGSTAMLVLLVPFVNLLLLPLASVGGTLLYCDLWKSGRLGFEPGELDNS